MRTIFYFFISFLIGLFANAQVININPDKSAEPWLVGGLRLPTQEEINNTPVLKRPDNYITTNLPAYLDNSSNMFFRPVFNQTHGSCSQASGVAYTFTYEINRLRNLPSNVPENQYPSHFTYNFLNEGDGNNGSWYQGGWEIIKRNGCPNITTYGGLAASETHWMSGYDKYISSVNNRIKDFFSMPVGTPEGLENLKYWMLDHFDGSEYGGIVNFAAGVTGEFYMTYDNKITEWGHTVNHAMTIVGWDDSIEYDYNNDGNITNDIDINNDDIVDMKDWERGALIMVNSWGTYWGNAGKAYIMYKTLAENVNDGGIYQNLVWGIHAKETQYPQLLLKLKMTHNSRNKISIVLGVSTDLSDEQPENVHFPAFILFQGGNNYMRGNGDPNPIEVVYDASTLLNDINSGEPAKFFLIVSEADPNGQYDGEIHNFSLEDNYGNVLTYTPQPENILNNSVLFMSVVGSFDYEHPTIQTQELPVAVVGEEYSFTLNATGGTTPYSWESLSVNPYDISITESGVIEGIIHQSGTWDIEIMVTDDNLMSDRKIFTLTTEAASVAEHTNPKISISPNPISDTASLKFQLYEKSFISISLYDITGKKIKNVENREMSSGIHSVSIKNEGFNGVYFLKFGTNNNQTIRKIIFN